MLYNLLYPLSDAIGAFNVFRYITFRTGGALLTSLIICFLIGPRVINWLKSKQKHGQPIRIDGPPSHLITKVGTPTMGGVLILASFAVSTLLWADLSNGFIWVVLLVTLGCGTLGGIDDYYKLSKRSSDGISARLKLIGQFSIATVAVIAIMYLSDPHISTGLAIPFFKNLMLDLGWFYIPWGIFLIVGASNSVNLTDGLDGLAIVPVMIAAASYCLIAYLVGNQVFANYLQINYVPGSGEIAILCGAMVGASLGFLWYNAPPAMVFMGDTGSLGVGAMLGSISLITKHELILGIIGGLFVIETISVILQVFYFKISGGRRIFLMAPIHHHFEKKGWAESTIVIRFWIVATILALIGLSSLKLR
jgi:phospho-N-acetylmuramoyl-pentapeptide-transferase